MFTKNRFSVARLLGNMLYMDGGGLFIVYSKGPARPNHWEAVFLFLFVIFLHSLGEDNLDYLCVVIVKSRMYPFLNCFRRQLLLFIFIKPKNHRPTVWASACFSFSLNYNDQGSNSREAADVNTTDCSLVLLRACNGDKWLEDVGWDAAGE